MLRRPGGLVPDGSEGVARIEASERGDAFDQGIFNPLDPLELELRFGHLAGRHHFESVAGSRAIWRASASTSRANATPDIGLVNPCRRALLLARFLSEAERGSVFFPGIAAVGRDSGFARHGQSVLLITSTSVSTSGSG
jgi:hypothetical protein